MKRLLLIMAWCLTGLSLSAQNEYHYQYWFDNQYDQHVSGVTYNPDDIRPDATTLDYGLHVFHIHFKDTSGHWTSTRSYFFFRSTTLAESQAERYTVWFDEDFNHRHEGVLGSEYLMFDVDNLSNGIHTVNVRLGNGTSSRLESRFFYKSSQGTQGNVELKMYYWFGTSTEVSFLAPAEGLHLLEVPDLQCGDEGHVHLLFKNEVGSSPLITKRFIMMDGDCCIPPLFVTVDSITETTARIHWGYNRMENFTLVIDTMEFDPDTATQTIALNDTMILLTGLIPGVTYHYAIKTDCYDGENPWVTGQWSNVCRVAVPVNIVACDSFEWFGDNLTQSGDYIDTVMNTSGYGVECDSIFQLHLSLYQRDSGEENLVVCRGLQWHDSLYIASTDTAIYRTHTIHGCDSIVYLHLTVNQPTHLDSTFVAESCASYQWYDRTYRESGRYIFERNYDDSPCPSFDTLALTVHPAYRIQQTVAIREGESYTFFGQPYSQQGTYMEAKHSVYGCDSLFILELKIKNPRLLVSSHVIDFGNIPYNTATSKRLLVSGVDLDAPIHLAIHGVDSLQFSLSQTVFSKNGGSVNVSFMPVAVQEDFEAYLVVTSDTLVDTVTLRGDMADYNVFTVSVPDTIMPATTPVPINGTLHNIAGIAQADVVVDVHVTVMGRTTVYTDTTDSQGQFSATYMPMSSESGYYEISATLHNKGRGNTLASFIIPGISILTYMPTWDVFLGDTLTGTIQLCNRCNITLHDVTMTSSQIPEGMNIRFDTLTLAPLQSANLKYTLIGNAISSGEHYSEAIFSASCAEGPLGKMNAYYYCYKPIADLQISFDTIKCAVIPGVQKVVDVALYNNTDSILNNVQMTLPSGQSYIQLLRADSIYNLQPYDTLFIPLLIMFSEGTPLASVTGEIYVSSDNTTGQTVPFIINVVSEATGSLRVLVSNEYTYYNNGPHVSGATVTLVDYYSLDTVATGITPASGLLIFNSLQEGYYWLYVNAPDNDSYTNLIHILAGQENFQNVDLEFQAVTYTWVVYQKDMEDNWGVRLDAEYKTNVPKPVLGITVPQFDIPWDGSFNTFNIVVTNHGLIDAYDATLVVPLSDTYEFVPLFDKVDTLHALSSIVIPCNVRNKRISDKIETIKARGGYVVDTVFSEHVRKENRIKYQDTTIYIPVRHYEYDTTDSVRWVYDTIYSTIPCVVTDTLSQIIERIVYFDTVVNDTLIVLSIDIEEEYGSCETFPYHVYAKWRCNAEGKVVYSDTIVEPMNCSSNPNDVFERLRNWWNSLFSNNDTTHSNPTTIGDTPRPIIDPRDPPRPPKRPKPPTTPLITPPITPPTTLTWTLHLPTFTLPEIPQLFTIWECEPCWLRVLRNSADCLSSIYTIRARRAVRNIATNTTIDPNDYLTYIESSHNILTESIRHVGDVNTGITVGENLANRDYLVGVGGTTTIQLLEDIIGTAFPVAGTVITCTYDVVDALHYCFGSRFEIPYRTNANISADTNIITSNISAAKRYYDTLIVIMQRIINDTSEIYLQHPEVLTSIVKRLVESDSATSETLMKCYDTTIIVIDRITLSRYAERWNRSVQYMKKGWLTPELVPEGYSTDFFYLDTNTTASLVEIERLARREGYPSIEEMFYSTFDTLNAVPNKRSVCAGVSLQFSQDMAMTREAFEGVLTIKNPHDTVALGDLITTFDVTDSVGNNCSDKFDISIIKREGIDDNDNIAPGGTGTVTVRFVPLMSAAPTIAVPYFFGGTIEYTNPYTNLPAADALTPSMLTVSPSPHLQLDYFVQRNVIADDPLTTPIIEPSVPATIGLRVQNNGFGIAKNVRLSPIQPQVIENRQGLVIDFAMVGSASDGIASSQPLCDIALGTMSPSETHTIEYQMKTSLLGTMTINGIHVIHSGSIGNRDMNLVDVKAHHLLKTVLQYGGESDAIHDFLTDDIDNGLNRPDSLFFSDGTQTIVHIADSITFDQNVSPEDTVVQVTLFPSTIGWNYDVTDDPGYGKYEIVSCVRDDNTIIPLENIWLTFVDQPTDHDPVYINKMHLIDTLDTVKTTTYNVTFRLKDNLLVVDSINNIPQTETHSPIDSIRVVFNKSVISSTFTFADMSLKCNNEVELMDSTVIIRQLNDTTFSVNIRKKQTSIGHYMLTVMADSIVDMDGQYGNGSLSAQWTTDCETIVDSNTVFACNSYMWHNTPITLSGIYEDTLTTNTGCDSLLILQLFIGSETTGIDTQEAYDNYTWIDGKNYTTSNNTAQYTLPAANIYGCDSTVTLHLTIRQMPVDSTGSFLITVGTDGHGTIAGGGAYNIGETVTLMALANCGYAFKQWNDGNTDNPRTVTVNCDTSYTAEFEAIEMTVNYTFETPSGQMLNYVIDCETKTACVVGHNGVCEGLLVIPPLIRINGVVYVVVSIGPSAFENCTNLLRVMYPGTILSIYENAFKGCTKLERVEGWYLLKGLE